MIQSSQHLGSLAKRLEKACQAGTLGGSGIRVLDHGTMVPQP